LQQNHIGDPGFFPYPCPRIRAHSFSSEGVNMSQREVAKELGGKLKALSAAVPETSKN
jgi:hypothetical protein